MYETTLLIIGFPLTPLIGIYCFKDSVHYIRRRRKLTWTHTSLYSIQDVLEANKTEEQLLCPRSQSITILTNNDFEKHAITRSKAATVLADNMADF